MGLVPYGEGHRVIYHPAPCMGWRLETCVVKAKKCILSIAVEEVLHAVAAVLGPERSGIFEAFDAS